MRHCIPTAITGPARLLLLVPLATILASYGAICWRHDTLWPWALPVHETGLTLLGAVLFFEHALREVPVDLVLGLAIGSAARPCRAEFGHHHLRWWFGLLTLLTLLIIVGGTLAAGGPSLVWENLLQRPTRLGEPLAWGAHWRYHLLSRLALILLALAASEVLRPGATGSYRPYLSVLSLFFALTLLFVPSLEPLTETLFLGHQARELFTHTLVTLPLGLVTCLLLVPPTGKRAGWPDRYAGAAGVAACVLGAYLLVGSLWAGAAQESYSNDLVTALAGHFFEHTFSYVLVPAVAGLTCLSR